MITLNHQKESLARAYIQAIAGRCGMMCAYSEFDYGIDVKVQDVKVRIDQRGGEDFARYIESGFGIAVQAKSTIDAIIEDDAVAYDIEAKSFNDLRDPEVGEPRILVLLVLPDNENEWLDFNEEQLTLRRCVYWHSLKGEPATNNKTRIRIRIPRTNLFDVTALRTMMERRKNGEDL